MVRFMPVSTESEAKCCKERCGRVGRGEEYYGQVFRINRIRKLERIIQKLMEKEKHGVAVEEQGRSNKVDSLNTVEHLTARLKENNLRST